MKVKLSDIIEAIETTDQYSEYFLDLETGEIVFTSDMAQTMEEKEAICDQLDEHGFYRLPSSFDIRDYDIMGDFVDTLSGSRRSRLLTALSSRGAFRNFKNEVRALGLDQQWYDYQEKAYRKRAIAWCKEHDLEWEE